MLEVIWLNYEIWYNCSYTSGEIAEMEGKMAFGTGVIAYMARLAATGYCR